MLFGLETVALIQTQETEVEVTELKMLRFPSGVTSLDRNRSAVLETTLEAGLKLFGLVERWDVYGYMDIYIYINVESCSRWSNQAGGKKDDQRRDSWMW